MVLNSPNNKFLIEANRKFMDGDAIDDSELSVLIKFYTEMSAGLKFLGPEFHLIWLEIFRRLYKLKDFRRSRLYG